MSVEKKKFEEGQRIHIRIGNRVVEATIGKDGIAHVQCDAREIPRPDGGQDVVVNVPCLGIAGKAKQPG